MTKINPNPNAGGVVSGQPQIECRAPLIKRTTRATLDPAVGGLVQ